MEVNYRNASMDDLDFLVDSRLDFIHISTDDSNYEFVKYNIQQYFRKGILKEQCDIVLAENSSSVIGTGIVFYYDSVPSTFNPYGKNAYITSMYVNENFRRKGIAMTILDKLIQIARAKKYNIFILQESDMGRPLYKKYGFYEGKNGMILKFDCE